MRFAAVAGVEAVKCSGNGGIGQRFATEQNADFEAFAYVNVGGIVQQDDFKFCPTGLVMMAVSALSCPTLTMFYRTYGFVRTACVRHFFDASLFQPALF